MSGRMWVIWFGFFSEFLSIPTFIRLPHILGFTGGASLWDSSLGFHASKNAVSTVAPTLMGLVQCVTVTTLSKSCMHFYLPGMSSFPMSFSIPGAVRPHSRGSSHSMAFCSTLFFLNFPAFWSVWWHFVPPFPNPLAFWSICGLLIHLRLFDPHDFW